MENFKNTYNNEENRLDLLLKSALEPSDRPDKKTEAQLSLLIQSKLRRQRSLSLWWLPSLVSSLSTILIVWFLCSVFRYCIFTIPICAVSAFFTVCVWSFTLVGLLHFNLKEAATL